MALHSVSYVLTVAISTSTRVVGWKDTWDPVFSWTHSEARGISLTEDGKEVSGALPQTSRDKSSLSEKTEAVFLTIINTYSHTTSALITVRTHTHAYLTTLNNIWTRVHCTRYYTSKTNVLQRDLEKHTYSVCVFLFVQGNYILLPVYAHLFCF